MNLILLDEADFRSEGEAVVTGRRADHIRAVLMAEVGDRLRVGRLGALLGEGTVTRMDPASVELQVTFTQPPPPPLSVTLLLALPRPKVLRRVIQGAVTLGVKRIALFGAFRVEKSYWHTPWLGEAELQEQVVLGLEQAGDTMPPVITTHPLFKPFFEDEAPALTAATRRLVADPAATTICPAGDVGPVSLVVGPEGGFTVYEAGLLREQGFEAVGLGWRILRTEQAVPALIGRLMA